MAAEGLRPEAPQIIQDRPEYITDALMLQAYYEIDRDPMSGALVFAGMRAVLDEYGWNDPEERRWVRSVWRAMDEAHRKKLKELKGEKDG